MNKIVLMKPVEMWLNYAEYSPQDLFNDEHTLICSICGKSGIDYKLPKLNVRKFNCFHKKCLLKEVDEDNNYLSIKRRVDMITNSIDPEAQFKLYLKELNKKDKTADNYYFITFTKKPDIELNKWYSRLRYEIGRKIMGQLIKGCIENHETNIHCHIYVKATQKIQKRDFSTYEKAFGYIDLKKVNINNGIEEYIDKQGKTFHSIGELIALS